jgi:hypothetical protein
MGGSVTEDGWASVVSMFDIRVVLSWRGHAWGEPLAGEVADRRSERRRVAA